MEHGETNGRKLVRTRFALKKRSPRPAQFSAAVRTAFLNLPYRGVSMMKAFPTIAAASPVSRMMCSPLPARSAL